MEQMLMKKWVEGENQNFSSISLGDKIATGDNFLSTLSPEKIGQSNLRASATYGESFMCSDSSSLAFGKNSENSDLGINVICFKAKVSVLSNISLDIFDLLNICSLCFSNSINKSLGATKSNLLNKSLRAKTLNELPLVNKEERTTLTSTTNSMFYTSLYLRDNDVLILSENSCTSSSVNFDSESPACNCLISSSLDLINLPTSIDQSMFGICLINVNSSGISILISMDKKNGLNYLNFSKEIKCK